jgi:hypothetical protein
MLTKTQREEIGGQKIISSELSQTPNLIIATTTTSESDANVEYSEHLPQDSNDWVLVE